jgi:pimeloyl-ACP methyl ester carboxylesterase
MNSHGMDPQDNRYIRRALSFSGDTTTHTYSTQATGLRLRGRDRRAVVEIFSPRSSDDGKVQLALIPGGALTPATNFYDLGPGLLAREPGRRFVFLDTPGTGLSRGKVRDLTHIDFARLDLAALRTAAGDAPVIVAGHSQGGGFAQTIARLNTEIVPTERLNLRGLLLLDPVPLRGAGYILWRFFKTLGSGRRIVHNIVASADVDDDAVAFFLWVLRADKDLSPRAFLANTFAHDFPDANHPVLAPTLILGAEASGTVRQERLREMEHSPVYPNARYEVIRSEPGETAGHLNYLSYERTLDAITSFLTTIDQSADAR